MAPMSSSSANRLRARRSTVNAAAGRGSAFEAFEAWCSAVRTMSPG